MKKKRIGVPFSGELIGGSHVSTMLLLDGLDPAVFEPVVILHSDGEVADFLRRRSTPFVIESMAAIRRWEGSPLRRLLASFQSLLPTMRLIRKHGLDLIHVQDHKAFQLWVWGALLARRPMLLHCRGIYGRSIVTRIMMRFATRIVAISRYLQDRLPAEVGRRAELIYNPFDTDEPLPDRDARRAALRAELGLPADSTLLCWIGTINRRKHPERFVEIVQRLRADRSDEAIFGVLCGGPGNLRDDPSWLRTLEDAGPAIRMLGFRDPIGPTLAGCDALVVTADEEPFGRTVIEAMLAGVPVVAADEGGYVEVMEHGATGLLVPTEDREGFAEAIAGLLDRPDDAQALTANARTMAEDGFSITRHVGAVEAVYRSLLDPPARSPSPGRLEETAAG
ncbi:MAG: glycosyltransferase family 4 protein [Pseudomonadota bacterium]